MSPLGPVSPWGPGGPADLGISWTPNFFMASAFKSKRGRTTFTTRLSDD